MLPILQPRALDGLPRHPRDRDRARRARRAGALLAAVVVLTLSLPGVAVSQGTPATADPEAALEETRGDLDEVAAELELLRQSDLALETRLHELDAEIATAASSLAVAEERATAAVAELARVEARVATARAQVADQQVLVDERAVSAYVDAGSAGLETMFTSTDANEFAERTLMIERVAEHDQTVLGRLEELKAALQHEEEAAAGARADAEASAAAAADALAGLEQARAEQVAVEDALELRIVAFEAEADELSATESQLVALIAERASQPEEPPPAPTTSAPPATTTTTDGGPGPTSPTTSPPSTAPPTTSPPPPPGPSFSWPTAGPVTSGFGWRWGRMHEGIDIGGSTGAAINASAGGTVILASVLGGYGNCVMIDHGSGFVTVYAHQSEILVSEGATVAAGETIGLVGSTGHSTGPHLHFEIRVGGLPYDPESYLP